MAGLLATPTVWHPIAAPIVIGTILLCLMVVSPFSDPPFILNVFYSSTPCYVRDSGILPRCGKKSEILRRIFDFMGLSP
jgi:hypothetical protein